MCNDRSWDQRQETPGLAPLLCFRIAESVRAHHITSLGRSRPCLMKTEDRIKWPAWCPSDEARVH